jgi:enediyne biosynthesis protein E4
MMKKVLLFLLFFRYAFAQTPSPTPFQDVTKKAGINHQFRVYEGMFGGGAVAFDYDRDGFEDLYITGGMNDDQLLHNNRNGRNGAPTFTNVFEQSGLTVTRGFVTQGVAAADVNRDGWVDLFVTTITLRNKKLPVPRAMNLLFLNLGNGQFRDATKEYGLDHLVSFSTGASFGDINADGYPDLYVGNYFNDFRGELTYINDATIVGATQTSKGYLLLNRGGKRFEDVYEDYDLTHKGFGFGGVFSDYDNDGDLDLIVNHDFGYKRTPNLVLQNQYRRKSFLDVAPDLQLDLKINAMGTAVGDINNDGLLDYYFTNIRFNKLMVSNGPGKPYTDQLQQAGMQYLAISWGANFADFDHDGDLDLFVSNGDLNPNCTPMGDFYFENNGRGVFEDNARAYGLNDYGIGRGSVTFDLENDGDLDLLVVNQQPVLEGYPVPSFTRLYRNDAAKGNWLKIALKGVEANLQGLGARVRVVAGGRSMLREIDGGASSHISQNSPIAHFGLGAATRVDSVLVIWPGGNKQILLNQPINKLLTITETPDESIGLMLWFGLGFGLVGLGVLAGSWWLKRKRSA